MGEEVKSVVEDKKISEEVLKAKAAKISIVEGSASSLMDAFGFRYITPYAVALGMSNTFIGLLSSVPQFLGSLTQIPSSKLVERYTRKRLVISAAITQSLMWLPLICVGLFSLFFEMSLFTTSLLLIVFYSLLVMSGSFASPAWNSWMKDLIVKNVDSYFAKRNLITGIVGLIGTFVAGNVLDLFNKYNPLAGFFVIFFIALIGRGISAYLFTKEYEPKYVKQEGYYFSFIQFVVKIKDHNFGRFSIFLSVMNFSVAIASPFFAVYMLKDLGFSYGAYTAVVTVSLITTLISMPMWGKFGDRFGNIAMLRLCGGFIFLVPLLWSLVSLFGDVYSLKILIYVLVVEAFSGFIWAGFNLSAGNFVYAAVTPQRLALCVAYNAALTAFGAFLGATLGGIISSVDGSIFGIKPLLFVFGLSTALRFLSVAIFLPKINEVRQVEHFGLEEELKKEFKKIKGIPSRVSRHMLAGLFNLVKRTGS